MSISEKIKAIDKKTDQNKVQYNLDLRLRFLLYHQEMFVSINF